VLDARGALVDFREVERRANAARISLRTGYFCNPGAAEYALEHEEDEVRRCAERFTPESWNLHEFSICLHDRPVGAVRASVGIPTNRADVERLVEVGAGFGE
jgi:selenocysteine lyase/cysteine desulfurase